MHERGVCVEDVLQSVDRAELARRHGHERHGPLVELARGKGFVQDADDLAMPRVGHDLAERLVDDGRRTFQQLKEMAVVVEQKAREPEAFIGTACALHQLRQGAAIEGLRRFARVGDVNEGCISWIRALQGSGGNRLCNRDFAAIL